MPIEPLGPVVVRTPALAASAVLAVGDPVSVLLQRTSHASLLVVGHDRHCAAGRMRHESIAHRMIGAATVPVMVQKGCLALTTCRDDDVRQPPRPAWGRHVRDRWPRL